LARNEMNRGDGVSAAAANFDHIKNRSSIMSLSRQIWVGLLALFTVAMVVSTPAAAQQTQRPNIVFTQTLISWLHKE
jgi:hypothetical protein